MVLFSLELAEWADSFHWSRIISSDDPDSDHWWFTIPNTSITFRRPPGSPSIWPSIRSDPNEDEEESTFVEIPLRVLQMLLLFCHWSTFGKQMGNARTCTQTMLTIGNTPVLIQTAITVSDEAARAMTVRRVPMVPLCRASEECKSLCHVSSHPLIKDACWPAHDKPHFYHCSSASKAGQS